MRRIILSTLVAVAIMLPRISLAQGHPDFSGTWTMDTAKSDPPLQGRGGGGGGGGRGGGAASVTITQTPTTLTVLQGPQTLQYKLDGSASTNEMAGRGGPTTAVSKARWDGTKLIIETTREIQGFSLTTKEVRSLAADGKEMTVESSTSTPQGDLNRKVVYSKAP